MTPHEVSARLSERAEQVARYLLPAGKKHGSEWRVGSVGGEKGQSLGVHIASDEKAGRWRDFAGDEGGDLLDLWQAVRHCDIATALREAKAYLGIREVELHAPKKKTFQKPKKPKNLRVPKIESPVMQYILSRGLTHETIQAFKVVEIDRTIVFPYIRDDELIMLKYQDLDRNEKGKRNISASKGAEPCLFGWHTIPPDARSVTITEGEFDTMAGFQIGKPCLSVPFGGGEFDKQAWIEFEYENLERFDRIYLALDNDSEGQKAAQYIAKRLGIERCYIVTLPYKDMNECLQNQAFEEVETAYLNARTVDPERLMPATSFRDAVHSMFDETSESKGMKLPWQKKDDLIMFRPQETTVWTGYSGHGKSELLGFIALWGIPQGYRFCIASLEMPAKVTLARMVRQATKMACPTIGYRDAVIDKFGPELWIYDKVGQSNIDDILEAFRYAAKRYNVKHFIIDSLVKLGIGEEDYDGQKSAVDKITAFDNEFMVHSHLVAHPRKGYNEDTPPRKLDVKGGSAITDMVDNVCVAWRNKPKEREKEKIDSGDITLEEAQRQNQGDTWLIVEKQRSGGREGRIALWHDAMSGSFNQGENSVMSDYVKYIGEKQEAK